MIERCLSFVLVGLVFFASNPVLIPAQTNGNASPAAKVKASVLKRGTGTRAKVNVKMPNGTQMKGYISQAGEDSFTLTDLKTSQTTTLAYSDVKQVKGAGGLSTAAKIAIGVGIGVAATVIVIGVAVASSDFGVW